jgi:hypothetical protein
MCVYFFSGIRSYRSSGHGGSFWNKELQKMGLAQHLLEFHPALNVNVLFCTVFLESHPVYDQTQGSGAVFFLLYR